MAGTGKIATMIVAARTEQDRHDDSGGPDRAVGEVVDILGVHYP
jgi:hypothetical protein